MSPMSTPTREPCPVCAAPLASEADYATWAPNPALCWSRYSKCQNKPVDWRSRALHAESALALMSTPLSPEAIQAIAEESAE